jgi:hypothetical protein
MVRDPRVLTDEVEFFDPPTTEQVDKARLIVAANGADAEEAAELMKMLGLYPGQENEYSADPLSVINPIIPKSMCK